MRIFVTMLGFNRPDMIRGAMENLEETTTDAEHRRLVKTVFYCGYPLPDPEANRQAVHRLAEEFGWWYADIPNEGVMGNHNRAIHEYCHMAPGDFYVTFDPDVRMRNKGWVTAMVAALRSDESTVFCCAARGFHDEQWCVDAHGRHITTIRADDVDPVKGLRVARYRCLLAWSMGMWKGEWLASRPRNFAAENQWYGYSEHADLHRMEDKKKRWCQVSDFYDDHLGADALYSEWKQLSAAHKIRQSFESWLQGRKNA
jgi:hypothetical protein